MAVIPESGDPHLARAIRVDTGVFSLSAIKKAAYRFSDRFYVEVDSVGGLEATVRLSAKPGRVADMDAATGEFRNELLDQDLRERIRAETEGIRRLLLAHALSRVPLIQPELENADYDADPSVQR
jgi:radical SAM pair-associated protein